MSFRTVFNQDEIEKPINQINYQSKVGLIGSCFVENIGNKFSYFKFQNWQNPYGILFNPKAIEKAIIDVVQQKAYTKKDLLFKNERWLSLHHHSDFSNPDINTTLHKINTGIEKVANDLKETSHLILTLGTAWVYHHITTDQLVANCHKIPQKHFIKRILSVDEIVSSIQNCIRLAKKINPDIQIILTVSPVLHLKDGMIQNSQSKAHLVTAVHKIIAESNAAYFPSYEMLTDDLRDYRFYTSDMMHPNQTAIDYVWRLFTEVWIAADFHPVMERVGQIQKGLQHKAFNPDSEQHKQFLENLKKQKKSLFDHFKITF